MNTVMFNIYSMETPSSPLPFSSIHNFTTKPPGKGTELGLAISHQIISEKHGGQLNFTSTPGVGTEFEILLPLF
jgi:C4-dicarboxylate-specific signal transduction histidine kinase